MSRNVPTNPSNSLTPSFSTVPSSNGFSSGDLVYYKDSNFGVIPNNAVTSGNFPITASVNQNQYANNTTVKRFWSQADGHNGSNSMRAQHTALLSNGNIVSVRSATTSTSESASYPQFKIIDQDGNVVVAKTVISTYGVRAQGCIGVCALSGGGFAVAYAVYNDDFRYAVYSNTGAVVKSDAPVSQFSGQSIYTFDIKPLANGGFAMAVHYGSSMRTQVFSSNGTAGTSTSAISMVGSTWAIPLIAAFSDSTFVVLYPTTPSNLNIARYDSTGAYIATFLVISNAYSMGSSGNYDITPLSDGTAVFAYVEQDTGNYYLQGYKYNPATVSATSIGYLNASRIYNTLCELKGLSGGGFILVASEYYYSSFCVLRYSNSASLVSSVNLAELGGVSSYTTSRRVCILEGATYLTFVDNGSFTSNNSVGNVPYFQVLLSSTSTVRKGFSANITVGIQSAPVSGYARVASTPNAASFLAASTQTITASQAETTGSTFTLTPYQPFSDQISWQSMCVMTDGRFVVAHTANNTLKFSVFNADGTLYLTQTVATSMGNGLCRCVCLGNGKLVVSAAPSSNNQVNLYVYSSTYSLLASGNTSVFSPAESPASTANAPGHDIAVLGQDNFAVCYKYSSNLNVVIFNDSVTLLAVNQQSFGVSMYCLQMAGNGGSNLIVRFYIPDYGYSYSYQYMMGSTTATIYKTSETSLTNSSSQSYQNGFVMLPAGHTIGCPVSTGTMYIERISLTGQTQPFFNPGVGSTQGSQNSVGVAVSPLGQAVFLALGSSNYTILVFNPGQTNTYYGNTGGYPASSVNISLSSVYSSGSQPRIASLYDNTYAFSYLASDQTLRVGLLNTAASSYSTTITAGVTPSNTALLPSPSNGYYLAGIAASDCTAGASGVIQTNGATSLSSAYPASTASQAFDFTSGTLATGVRGVIAGRNVIISGSN